MSVCADYELDLVAEKLGLLETERADAIAQHLASCARCSELQASLQREVESCLALPDDEVPATVWAKVAAQVEVAQARSQLRIVLGCTFCHDDLPRVEAVYCATCLAPHHADCFREHKRCSTPGCGDTEFVQSKDAKKTAPIKPWAERLRGMLIGTLLLAGVAVAAMTPSGQEFLFGGEDDPPVIAVDWPEDRWVRRGSDGHIAVHVNGIMLNRVMDEYRAKTGIDVEWDAKLDGPVSLNIPYSSPREILNQIARRVGAIIEEGPDGSLRMYRPKAIDAVFHERDVREALQEIGEASGLTIIMDPRLKGKVTCDLRQISPLAVVNAIVGTVDEELVVVEETDDLLRIVHRDSIEVQLERVVLPVNVTPQDAKQLTSVLKGALPSGEQGKGCSVVYLPDKKAYVVTAPRMAIDEMRGILGRLKPDHEKLPRVTLPEKR